MRRLLILAAMLAAMLALAVPAWAGTAPDEHSSRMGWESRYYAQCPFPDWLPDYCRDEMQHDYNTSSDRVGYQINAFDAQADNPNGLSGPWQERVYGE